MNVLLLQLDGKLPNLALMRICAHHRERGDIVTFRRAEHATRVAPQFGDKFDKVYASAIFTKTIPICQEVQRQWPGAIIGGTGWSVTAKVEDYGISTDQYDYSIYPHYRDSIGFTQRGCRLKCEFCVVPKKEGRVAENADIMSIWRGDPWPRHLVLLDNDFFGSSRWKEKIQAIRDGGFRVSFNQGINARCITDEAAEAIASVQYYADDFKTRRIYTAWDSRADEERLFKGLNALVRYGVKPDHIMVYMLIGYWPGETHADRDYRRARLRDFGARPYPMTFAKTRELIGFSRWVIGAYDRQGHRNYIPWEKWIAADQRPEKVPMQSGQITFPIFGQEITA